MESQKRTENKVLYEGKMPIAERWILLTRIFCDFPFFEHAIHDFGFSIMSAAPSDAMLPEGARVVVEYQEEDFPEWSRGFIKLITKRDRPEDMVLNHDHYLHGLPKR